MDSSGGTKLETSITTKGVLTVAKDETAETLSVKATSAVGNSKNGAATITVSGYHNFHESNVDGAEIVEIEFMGKKRLCHYIDGQYIIEHDIVIYDENYEVETNSKISTRAAMISHDWMGKLWPQGKVYYYRDGMDVGLIRDAIDEIQTATNNVNGVFSCVLGGLKSNTSYEAGAYYKFNGDAYYFYDTKVEFTTKPETPAPPVDQWWNLREFKSIISQSINSSDIGKSIGVLLNEKGDDFQEYYDRPSNMWSSGIKGKNFEYEWSYWSDSDYGVTKYTGTINNAQDYISGTYTFTRWDNSRRETLILIANGRFEMWKIEKPANLK